MFQRLFLSHEQRLERNRDANTQQFVENCLSCTAINLDNGIAYTCINNDEANILAYFLNNLSKTRVVFTNPTRILQDSANIDAILGKSTYNNCLPADKIALWQSLLRDYLLKQKVVDCTPIKNFTIIDQVRILLLAPQNFLALAAQNSDPTYLNAFITNFHKSVIHAALLKINNNKTALEHAAIHQESKSFINFIAALDTSYINRAISLVSLRRQPCAIHYAAHYQSTEALEKLFDRLTLKEHYELETKDHLGLSLLESFLLRHSTRIALRLWKNQPSKISAYLLEMFSESYDLAVNLVASGEEWHVFLNLLNPKSPSSDIFLKKLCDKILVTKEVHPKLINKLIASTPNLNKDYLINNKDSLIQAYQANQHQQAEEKQSSTSLTTGKNRSIPLSDPNFATIIWQEGFASHIDFQKAYTYARRSRNSVLLCMLDVLLSIKKFYVGLTITPENYFAFIDDQRSDRFHHAVKKYNAEEIENLLEILPQTILNAAVIQQDDKNQTGLKVAAHCLAEKPFSILCNRVSTDVLQDAMVIADDANENAFHNVAVHQSADNFILFLKLSDLRPNDNVPANQRIRNALLQKNRHNATPVHLAAYFQDGNAISALIGKMSYTFYGATLRELDNNGNTFLHLVIARQPEAVVKELIDVCFFSDHENFSRYAFYDVSKNANNNNQSILDLAFKFQSPSFAFYLIDKCLNQGLITFNNSILPHILKNPYSKRLLVHSLLTQKFIRRDLIKLLIGNKGDALSEYFRDCFIEAHFYGMTMPEPIIEIYKQSPYPSFNSTSFQFTLSELSKPFSFLPSVTLVQSSQHTTLDPNDATFLPTLLREGLLSLRDYRALQKLELTIPRLRSTLERLLFSNRLFSGSYQDLQPETNSEASLDDVAQAFNYTLLQFIPEADWPTFLLRLNRQPIEEKLAPQAKKITHQYRHLEDDIVPFVNDEDKEEIEKYPVRNVRTIYLADGLSTNVVNEEKIQRVGICYKLYDCKTVALFTREVDTQQQEWLGSEKQVAAYRRRILPFSEKSLLSFQSYVADHPYQVNLTLAHVSQEAAFAICIVDNTLEARLYARKMASDFSATFHRYLPIVCFNYLYRSLRMYLPEEQAADVIEKENGIKLNPFLEQEAKARLLALRDDIQANKKWGTKSSLFSQAKATTPQIALDIVKAITETTKAPLPFWEKTANSVNKQLKSCSGKSDDNEKFFEAKRTQYFK